MRKRVILTAVAAIGLVVLGATSLIYYANYPDRDMPDRARLYRARTDIAGIENAVRLFHETNGKYPQTLTELARKPGDTGNDKPWLIEMPVSPWGGSYHYQVESGPAGESYKIWTVPDRRTQEQVKLAELSNATDWRAIAR